MSRKVNTAYTPAQVKGAFKVFERDCPPGFVSMAALEQARTTRGWPAPEPAPAPEPEPAPAPRPGDAELLRASLYISEIVADERYQLYAYLDKEGP